jgi:hypothetical protein
VLHGKDGQAVIYPVPHPPDRKARADPLETFRLRATYSNCLKQTRYPVFARAGGVRSKSRRDELRFGTSRMSRLLEVVSRTTARTTRGLPSCSEQPHACPACDESSAKDNVPRCGRPISNVLRSSVHKQESSPQTISVSFSVRQVALGRELPRSSLLANQGVDDEPTHLALLH